MVWFKVVTKFANQSQNLFISFTSSIADHQAPPALLNFGLLVAPGRSWSLLVAPGRSWSLLVTPGRSWSLCNFDIRTSSSHKLHVEACTYAFHNDLA